MSQQQKKQLAERLCKAVGHARDLARKDPTGEIRRLSDELAQIATIMTLAAEVDE